MIKNKKNAAGAPQAPTTLIRDLAEEKSRQPE